MMSVGGTIGTGLFVASGQTVATAGPAGALTAFLFVGIMVFCVLTSLGEMAALIPVSGSFHEFVSGFPILLPLSYPDSWGSMAGRFVDPALAWTLGWNYWLQWSVSLASEITAAGIIMTFWFPETPAWIFSAVILAALFAINTRPVTFFGETEYGLSILKVATVCAFICIGVYVDIFGSNNGGIPAMGFANWQIEGAPFKNGFGGVVSVVAIAFFAFGGTELVGISAGEVENPRKNVPTAINQTFWRILIFYVCSVGIIGLLIRNDDPSLSLSAKTGDITIAPFTLILHRIGFSSAANFMNLIVLSAVISTANSAMYAGSRTLMALSRRGQAPLVFGVVNVNGVPIWALLLTVSIGAIAFLGMVFGEGELFTVLLTVTGTSGLLTWLSISLTHIRFRGALESQNKPLSVLPYRSPYYPLTDYGALAIGLAILVGQAVVGLAGMQNGDGYIGLVPVFAGVPLFFGVYALVRRRLGSQFVNLEESDLGTFAMPSVSGGEGVGVRRGQRGHGRGRRLPLQKREEMIGDKKKQSDPEAASETAAFLSDSERDQADAVADLASADLARKAALRSRAARLGGAAVLTLLGLGAYKSAVGPCSGPGHRGPDLRFAKSLWFESNGTVATPPESLVVHFDPTVINASTVALHWGVRTGPAGKPHPRPPGPPPPGPPPPELNERSLHARGGPPPPSAHPPPLTDCAPTTIADDGTVVFGKECVDIVAAYEQAESGTELDYIVVATAKTVKSPPKDGESVALNRRGASHHGNKHGSRKHSKKPHDDDDSDDDDTDDDDADSDGDDSDDDEDDYGVKKITKAMAKQAKASKKAGKKAGGDKKYHHHGKKHAAFLAVPIKLVKE
ncbi:hypothetical protein HDU83_007367 [Entophlyctis luteolus]|nr:hypothetical protein HDU83_007367 [Entophlyctis luteolus]